jgi:type I restriction enzyme R subunit
MRDALPKASFIGFTGTAAKRLPLIAQAAEHVLQQKDGKQRYLQAVSELSKAFALAVPHDSALEIRDEVGFYQEMDDIMATGRLRGLCRRAPPKIAGRVTPHS